jgi:hypothetical protein
MAILLENAVANESCGATFSSDLTLVFKARADALDFVKAGEAQGFKFAGNELRDI